MYKDNGVGGICKFYSNKFWELYNGMVYYVRSRGRRLRAVSTILDHESVVVLSSRICRAVVGGIDFRQSAKKLVRLIHELFSHCSSQSRIGQSCVS